MVLLGEWGGSTLLSGVSAVWLKLLFRLLVALGDQLPKQTAMSVINTSDGIRGMADLALRGGGRGAGAAKIYTPPRLLLISQISWTHAEASRGSATPPSLDGSYWLWLDLMSSEQKQSFN